MNRIDMKNLYTKRVLTHNDGFRFRVDTRSKTEKGVHDNVCSISRTGN